MEKKVVQNNKPLKLKKQKIVCLNHYIKNNSYCGGQTQQTTEGPTGCADAIIMAYITM